MPTLQDELDDLLDDLQDSKDTVGDQLGPLTGADLTTVTNKLSSAGGHITAALAEISNAGVADEANIAATLPAIALDCKLIAQAAFDESNEPTPNTTKMGSYIKTVEWMIDVATVTKHGYRERAGIS